MATDKKTTKPKQPTTYDAKVGIKGEFLDVFKVVKKHKEQSKKRP